MFSCLNESQKQPEILYNMPPVAKGYIFNDTIRILNFGMK